MKASFTISVMISALLLTVFVICQQPRPDPPIEGAQRSTDSTTPPTIGIEITSVDFDILWNFDGHLSEIPLPDLYDREAMIISDSEILKYGWQKQILTVSTAGSDRIPRAGEFAVGSQYFVLGVNGNPRYLGAIETMYYSDEHYMPMILVNKLPTRGGDEPVEFQLDPCYTFGGSTVSVDKRFDARLRQYLADTKRLH